VTKDGIWIGFIDHLYTPLGSTSNYSAIANLHTLQITAAFFQPAISNSRFIATASNNGDSSASRAHVVTIQPIYRNWTLVTHQPATSRHFAQAAWGPRSIASERTQQKTLLPTVFFFFFSIGGCLALVRLSFPCLPAVTKQRMPPLYEYSNGTTCYNIFMVSVNDQILFGYFVGWLADSLVGWLVIQWHCVTCKSYALLNEIREDGDDLRRLRRKETWPSSRYYHGILRERLSKT
jgi:hypothetical protein